MSKKIKGKELLSKLDAILESLTQLRNEVAEWMDEHPEASHHAHTLSPSTTLLNPVQSSDTVSSSPELSSTVESIPTTLMADTPSSDGHSDISFTEDAWVDVHNTGAEDDAEVVFIPKHHTHGASTIVDSPLSPAVSDDHQAFRFYPRRRLSLADTFLFANEFFLGNRAELDQLLDDIEHLSTQDQVEHLLFEMIRLDRSSDTVQYFLELVMSNSDPIR